MERVASNGHKSEECHYCTEIPVSADGLRRVVDVSEPYVMKSFFHLPPVHKYYYTRTHADYVDPPADRQASESSLRFIYPADGAVMSLPRKADNSPAQIIGKAAHTNPCAQLFWHLDNNYIGSTTDIHQIQITPSPGVHRLTIFDNLGAERSIEFIIR